MEQMRHSVYEFMCLPVKSARSAAKMPFTLCLGLREKPALGNLSGQN